MARQYRIVIAGAGPAGLAAAYKLTRNNVNPVIFEKSDQVGGIARTEVYKQYAFDIGGHRYFSKDREIRRLWNEILGDDLLRVKRISRIFYQGKLIDYPLSLPNVFFNLGIMESVLTLTSFIKARCFSTGKEETFEQWVSKRFGQRLYHRFFKPYTEKVWGIPGSAIRSDWAVQRIKGLSLSEAISSALLRTQNADSLIRSFEYPVEGSGMMWKRLKDMVEIGGGRFHLKSEVIALEIDNMRIENLIWQKGEETGTLPVDHFISSMPVKRLVHILGPDVPDAVRTAADKLSYRFFIMVVLIIEKQNLFPDQWIYIQNPDVRVGRIQNFKNWSAAMVPDPDKTCLGMEYFCDEKDKFWHLAETDIIDMACRELITLELAQPEEIIDHCVVRQPYAYPVFDRDYRHHLKIVREYLRSYKNLQTVGRGGTYRYSNMDQAMKNGMMAAENITGAEHDLWQGNMAPEYLEAAPNHMDERMATREIFEHTFRKMEKTAFAVATGLICGLLLFIATIWLVIKGGKVVGPNLALLSNYFFGYTVTIGGAFIGFGYSFIWGFVFGWLFAFIRNLFVSLYLYRLRRKIEKNSIRNFIDRIITLL